ncbi:MAG: FAD-binding protein [Arcobacter sp.]|nr:FAD-binding protein [Arcobacter sp.]
MIDVLIVGSGGAALTAAINAKKEGVNVLVVSKTFPTHSQTCQAQGGINAVLENNSEDTVDNFIHDTYKASHKLANFENISYLCKNSKDTITWLDSIGVPFSRNSHDNIAQRKFGGTKAKRTCYSSDYTGLKILHTLYDQCIKEGIKFLNEHFLINLIVIDNQVRGITVLDIKNSEVKEINSKTVILATGGYAGIYSGFTTNSNASTGDGLIAAYNAGAKLSNMEFVQFHPTALENKNILVSESARGEGGFLVTSDEKRFIDELKPRDEVARAIFKLNQNKQRVFLDLRHLGLDKINNTMPQERRLAQEFLNLNMESDLIPINPSAHYSMGGILTNTDTQTNIENLYACGECSQSGIHGANRLGGNSLLEIITFGKVSGINAAKKSKNTKNTNISNSSQFIKDKNYINSLFINNKELNFYEDKEKLAKKLFNTLGLFREEESMSKTLSYIENIERNIEKYALEDKSKIYNTNLTNLIEFKNIVLLSKIISISAINRKESRGAHFRTDFQDKQKEFDKNTVVILNKNKTIISLEELI